MRILKRLAIWLMEVGLQAVLLGLLLIGLYGHDKFRFGRDLLVYTDSILVMFFLTGYLLTTAILRVLWKGRTFWLYPVIAMALFLFHFELLNLGIGGAFAPPDRTRVLLAGMCAAAITTLCGTLVLQRWRAERLPTGVQA